MPITTATGARRPCLRRSESVRYACEELETRRLLAVIFKTDNSIVASDGTGPVINSPHVEVIYWGSGWNSANPSRTQMDAAIDSIVGGPYLKGLSSYRAGITSGFRNASIFYTTTSPAANITDATIQQFVKDRFNDGTVPRPTTDANLLYMVIPQPGTTDPAEGAGGAHTYVVDNLGHRAHYGWTINDNSLDRLTYFFSHELAESVTDPEGNGIHAPIGGDNEICDGVAQNYDARLNGYRVNSYWVQSKHAYEINFDYTGNQDCTIAFTPLGLATLTVNGDQFSTLDDTLAIYYDTFGGVGLNMNNSLVSFMQPGQTNAVTSVTVNGGNGSDSIFVTKSTGAAIPVTVNGGNGTDSINARGLDTADSFSYFESSGVPHINGTGLTVTCSSGVEFYEFLMFGGNDTVDITSSTLQSGFSVFGLDGNDRVFIEQLAANQPINVYGGNNDDTLTLGQEFISTIGPVDTTINYDGETGANTFQIDDSFSHQSRTMSVAGNSVTTSNSPGHQTTVNLTNTATRIFLGSTAADTFNVGGTVAGISTYCHGGAGDDQFNIGALSFSESIKGPVAIFGDDDFDTVTVTDIFSLATRTYTFNKGSMSSSISALLSYSDDVNLLKVLAKTGTNVASVFNVLGNNSLPSLDLTGDGGPDQLNIGLGTIFNANGDVTFHGGSGSDFVVMDDHLATPYSIVDLDGNRATYAGGSVTLDSVENFSALGSSFADLLIAENMTPGMQITLTGNGGGDNIRIDEHLAAAPDTVIVDEASGLVNSIDPAALWHIRLPGAANTGGIDLYTPDAGAEIDVRSTFTGEPFNIYAGAGADTVNISSNAPTNTGVVTTLGGTLTVNSGGADDSVFISNAARTTTDEIAVDEAGAGFSSTYNPWHIKLTGTAKGGGVHFKGGSDFDQFNVKSTVAGESLYLDGAAGGDTYVVGNAGSVQGIAGPVIVDDTGAASANSAGVDNHLVAVDTTMHVDPNYVGAGVGDNLFPPGAYFSYSNIQTLTVKVGNGSDTVWANPNLATSTFVEANDPTVAPGDTANVILSSMVNPVFHDFGGGTGSYTYDNGRGIGFFGFENFVTDTTPPAALAGEFQYDVPKQYLKVYFSEDVSATLSVSVLSLTNLTLGETLPPEAATYSDYSLADNSATFTFPTFEFGALPDGNYTATVLGGTYADNFGNISNQDLSFPFFFLNGDANHDGTVDSMDFVALADHFGAASGVSFSSGDFNYDGIVNALDFNELATKFGTMLSASVALPSASATVNTPRAMAAAAPSGSIFGRSKISSLADTVLASPDDSGPDATLHRMAGLGDSNRFLDPADQPDISSPRRSKSAFQTG